MVSPEDGQFASVENTSAFGFYFKKNLKLIIDPHDIAQILQGDTFHPASPSGNIQSMIWKPEILDWYNFLILFNDLILPLLYALVCVYVWLYAVVITYVDTESFYYHKLPFYSHTHLPSALPVTQMLFPKTLTSGNHKSVLPLYNFVILRMLLK